MPTAKDNVRSVSRAFHILSAFSLQKGQLTLTEICEHTKLAKSTASRLLVTLVDENILIKTRDNKYQLGSLFLFLGDIAKNGIELRQMSLPFMQELASSTKETINLNVVEGRHRICLERVLGSHEFQQFVTLGKPLPLHKGASGKLLLAYLPKAMQDSIYEEHVAESNITREEYYAELDEIASQGYALSNGDRVLGAAAISVPLYDASSQVIGGLTISSVSVRFTSENSTRWRIALQKTAKQISKNLGYRGV